MQIYDYIVIGSGISGLYTAAKISQETKNILLLEAEQQIGGAHKPVQLQGQTIENGLRFYPYTELSAKALTALEDFLGLKLFQSEIDNHPETYEASGFKSFVGFGDKSPEFYDQLSYFLSNKETSLTLSLHQITHLLQSKYQGELFFKSHVTKINFEGSKAVSVTVNGNKTYHANNIIFAGNPRDLIQLLPDEVFGIRAKVKFKKDTAWTSLCLDLCHETTVAATTENSADKSPESLKVEKTNLFILNGTTDDDIGPCVGRFYPGFEKTLTDAKGRVTLQSLQISQWLSFVDVDSAEETENIAEVLKKMKRQIRRAFPAVAENIKGERLFMSSPLSCGELKLNSNGTFHKTDNLWIASGQINHYPNLLGSLLQAQLTLAALGFGPEVILPNEATAKEATEVDAES